MSLKIIPDPTRPLPDDYSPEDAATFEEKVRIAAKTAKLLLEAGGEFSPTAKNKEDARDILKAYADPNATKAETNPLSKYLNTPATVQHLAMMLSDYDHQVVEEAVQLRRYITNKLIEDTNLPDPRHRLRALELLGKISDVGLFSDKTEITVKSESKEELEAKIRSKLFKILGNNATVVPENNIIDVDSSDELD